MYDALTTRYTFSCPNRGETRVRLSAFRALDRLPGAGHPAVFQVVFDCPCGCEHPGLVSDVELDWAPLGHSTERFLNLMTDRFESTEEELADLAVRRILAGDWPWSFYLLPGAASAARLSVVVLPARSRRRVARARRPLPGLRARLGQPRDAGARRPPVPQRPRDRRPAARPGRRCRGDGRGVPR